MEPFPDSDAPLDPIRFGSNIRGLRLIERLTQGELAKLSGVTLTTVYSAEKGARMRIGTLKKIAAGLNTSFDSLASRTLFLKTPDLSHVMHKTEQTIWFSEQDQRRQIPKDNHERIQDPVERARLGHLGLVPSFVTLPSFVMLNGPGLTLIELYGNRLSTLNAGAYRDSVIYCLKGPVLAKIREDQFRLNDGESAGFSSIDLEELKPEQPLGPKDPPALLLWVGAERIGKVPMK